MYEPKISKEQWQLYQNIGRVLSREAEQLHAEGKRITPDAMGAIIF